MISATFMLLLALAPWQQPVQPPPLPKADVVGFAAVHGVRLWYAAYGRGKPVILLHGAVINANWWALQVRALMPYYRVIIVDNRGHGRSTGNGTPLTYDLMGRDVISLMDTLGIHQAALVGWSDGANIGLSIAIHHPERLTKVFAFAGNSSPAGLKPFTPTAASRVFMAEASREYRILSPTPNGFAALVRADARIERGGSSFSARQLASIRIPVWIVAGDRDQFIKRSDTDYLAAQIPGAGELILPNVSHGAPLQDPSLFNAVLLQFLR